MPRPRNPASCFSDGARGYDQVAIDLMIKSNGVRLIRCWAGHAMPVILYYSKNIDFGFLIIEKPAP